MQGKLEETSLVQVLQSLTVLGVGADVRVETPRGSGEIYIRGGQILHATFRGSQGEEALFHLLASREGRFEVQPGTRGVPKTIEKPAHELLLDLSRRLEEGEVPIPPSSQFETTAETVQILFQSASTLEYTPERLSLTAVQERWSGVLRIQGSEGQGEFLLYKGNILHAQWKTPLEQVLTGPLAVAYFNRVCEDVEHLLSFARMSTRMVWAVLPLYEDSREGDAFSVSRLGDNPGTFLDFLVKRGLSGTLKVILRDREAGILFFEGNYLGTYDLKTWATLEGPFEVLQKDAFAQLYVLNPGKRRTIPWKSKERVFPVYEIQEILEDLNFVIKQLTLPYLKKYSYRSLIHMVERAIEESGFPGSFKSEDKRLVLHHLRTVEHADILNILRALYRSILERARSEIGKKEVGNVEKALKKKKSPLVG